MNGMTSRNTAALYCVSLDAVWTRVRIVKVLGVVGEIGLLGGGI